mmetsp:Transcript_13052/g.28091  ORF Transcript_13052/g.28091 Transcript_13052/m.28091 type:complete len:131 (-) Transcript_13052:1264-1656(-)
MSPGLLGLTASFQFANRSQFLFLGRSSLQVLWLLFFLHLRGDLWSVLASWRPVSFLGQNPYDLTHEMFFSNPSFCAAVELRACLRSSPCGSGTFIYTVARLNLSHQWQLLHKQQSSQCVSCTCHPCGPIV